VLDAGISDAGLANLAGCGHLEDVNLLGTPARWHLRALAGKRNLSRSIPDAASLMRINCYTSSDLQDVAWRRGQLWVDGRGAKPNKLLLDGHSERGLARLAGLDGLFGLTFFWLVRPLRPRD